MAEKSNFGRRTWDREEYAKQARLRHVNKDKVEQEKVPKSLVSRGSLDFSKDLNKRQVITGNVVSTRGRSFGFYCEICDLTFKDNLKFVDHLNSKPHLIKAGELNQERHVTLEEVKEHYDKLVKKIDESMKDDEKYNIKEKIERRRKFEEERKAHKRAKKEVETRDVSYNDHDDNSDPMKAAMGFSGFSSTKK